MIKKNDLFYFWDIHNEQLRIEQVNDIYYCIDNSNIIHTITDKNGNDYIMEECEDRIFKLSPKLKKSLLTKQTIIMKKLNEGGYTND